MDFVDIYTSFAVVIIALMWLYISWIILLVGAQASFYAQHPEYIRAGYRQISVGHELRERIALGLMVLVARAFRSPSQPSMNTNEIAARMNVPGILVSPIKQRLIANGVLATLDKDILVPARDPATISLAEILQAVRGPISSDSYQDGTWPQPVRTLFSEINLATRSQLQERNLYDLLEAESGTDPT